ncbi:MAG: hypothetical protein HUJ98_09270 [Bacteroidaceae bacterium]|nr:hypothetical protein [Bacteroidaceae bacterium]
MNKIMKEDFRCKVLWVEDDNSIYDGYQSIADTKGIELDIATCWDEAERKLKDNFSEYSAIILDAYCKISKESKPSVSFSGEAVNGLYLLFGKKSEFIPWYVLSAGTMENFGNTMDFVNTQQRKQFEEDWGKMCYMKDRYKDVEDLFNNICKNATNKTINKVLFRHADVFKWVGKGKIIDSEDARICMRDMLSTVYNSTDSYDSKENKIREMLEYIVRSAHNYNLIPEYFVSDFKVENLRNSIDFLCGYDVKNGNGYIRFGKRGLAYRGQTKYVKDEDGKSNIEGEKCDSVFCIDAYGSYSAEGSLLNNLLNFSNPEHHTSVANEEIETERISVKKEDLFFGHVLHLCHIIKYFGEYVKIHKDKERNKEMIIEHSGHYK